MASAMRIERENERYGMKLCPDLNNVGRNKRELKGKAAEARGKTGNGGKD
jgi:hypothetical protein